MWKTEPELSNWRMPPTFTVMEAGENRRESVALTVASAGMSRTTVPIGDGVDANGFDPGAELAFSSNGDGTLTVAHEDSADKYTVVGNATTQRSARTMALNPGNHDVYLVAAEFDEAPPAEGQTRPRRTMKPGTFTLLVMSKK